MHYLPVISFKTALIRVLILRPQVLVKSCSVLVANTTCVQTKDSTEVPPGLFQPLLVLESRLTSWHIDFTID